MILQQKRI